MVDYVDTEYERGLYREYVEAREMKLDHFADRLRRISPALPRGGALLDVGCSCGYFLETAARHGYDVHGVEFSKTAISAADPSVRSRIIQGSLEELPLDHRSHYDVITAFDLIEHLDQPKQFLARASELLKPGGKLVLSTPDAGHFLRYVMGSRWPMLQPMQHLSIFSDKTLRVALHETGYTEVRVETAYKTISYEYLFNQLRLLMPLTYSAARVASVLLPSRFMRKYRRVNIGELLAIATMS